MKSLPSRVQAHLSSMVAGMESAVWGEAQSQPQIADELPLGLEVPHRFFTPEHFERNYAYPLVIWLHSQDSSEYELDSVMPAISLRNYVGLALRGTHAGNRPNLYAWGYSQTAYGIVEESVLDALSLAVETFSINPSMVFLAGQGQGGTLAQAIGLRHPERFAGVVSFNGIFPDAQSTLWRWKEARRLPVLSMHSGVAANRQAEQLLRSVRQTYAFGLRYQFAEFVGDDDLNTAMTQAANRFMMGWVTGESSAQAPRFAV